MLPQVPKGAVCCECGKAATEAVEYTTTRYFCRECVEEGHEKCSSCRFWTGKEDMVTVNGERVCVECCSEYHGGRCDEDADWYGHDEDDYLIDGVGFANEGSALRAETPHNPRNLPCPTCGRENTLTPLDVAAGYQCDRCADASERGY